MTTETAGTPSQRDKCTITLLISQEEYEQIVRQPMQFRAWIDKNYGLHPEIFPETFKGKRIFWRKFSLNLYGAETWWRFRLQNVVTQAKIVALDK